MVSNCETCATFTIDWLSRPSLKSEYFALRIHPEILEKILPVYIPQILRLIGKIDSLVQYIIESKLNSVICNWQQDHTKWTWTCDPIALTEQEESEMLVLEWDTMTSLVSEHVSASEIEVIQAILVDTGAFRGAEAAEVALLWIGMTLRELLRTLPVIHLEHSKESHGHVIVDMESKPNVTASGLAHIRGHKIAEELFD